MLSVPRRLAAISAIAILVAACSGGTPAPTTPAATGPGTSAVPSVAVPSPVANIPSDKLVQAGKLIVCSDIPYPPFEFLDDQGNPVGSDIEIAQGIADRLGLKLEVVNTVFDYIIPAVTGGKCDLIVSDQNISPDRTAQVDMIPYFKAGQAFAVLKGNPENIATELDLCGKKVAAETSTTEVQYLEGTDTYKTNGGLKGKCTAAGKTAPEAVKFEKDTDAFLALQANQVDAYFADLPVVGYYVQQHGDQFEIAPIPPLAPITVGMSVVKVDANHPATASGHTVIGDAVKAALLAMMADGSYTQILDKFGLGEGALTPADVVFNKG